MPRATPTRCPGRASRHLPSRSSGLAPAAWGLRCLRLPGASEGGAGLSRTCANTVRVPSRAAAFTRPCCHAAPAPARATPATAAARGPRLGIARRPAASPRLSLPPQAASRALLPAAAAIFAEAPERRAPPTPSVARELSWALARAHQPPPCSALVLLGVAASSTFKSGLR